jgi:hypothetical protein
VGHFEVDGIQRWLISTLRSTLMDGQASDAGIATENRDARVVP